MQYQSNLTRHILEPANGRNLTGGGKMWFDENTNVVGYYLGKKYTGRIDSKRFHSVNRDHCCYVIFLDAPITIYGELRETIMVNADFNGNPIEGFSPATILPISLNK
jgi:hypothetical protein